MFATSDDHPRLQVPLESVGGEAPPRLISFEVMKPPNRDIALLHIDAGQMPGASAPEEVRHVAILDLAQRTVLGVVPDRQGQRQAKWAWEDSKLVITAADGLTDEFQLRGGGRTPSAAVAATGPRRQYSEGPRTYAPPGWLPWGGQPQPQRRAGRQQPKTLLDMLFGN